MNASRTATNTASFTPSSRMNWYDYSVISLWIAAVVAIGASFLGS